METKIIEMAALGRALYPGMLYDCRNDTFIPGITLWDKTALRDDLDVHDQTKTFVKLAAADSVTDKASLLNVNASLKASFLGGLVEVGGSAKYLQDSKSSARQCRVTMQYSQTTKFEQLTMKELGNITYPQVFEQKTATHVVTAVLYGASAFMVFDYASSQNENKQAAEGNLYAVVKKIPTISIEGQASLKMSAEEKSLSENINVTFYGDYELEENPTTYTEALRACKRLPGLLKERNSKGVPLTVWLYPLTLLNSKAAKFVREITVSLVTKTESVLEELADADRRCNDLLSNSISASFPDVKKSLQQFKELLGAYKVTFQKALVNILPGIRSGTLENKALGDILNNHGMSPFTATSMNKWLDNISTQITVLNSYTSTLKDITFLSSEGLFNSILFDPSSESVVCLTFTSLNSEDPYLVATQTFVNSPEMANFGQKMTKSFSYPAAQVWYTSLDVSARMKQNLTLFNNVYKMYKNDKRIKCVIASIPDPSNPGTSIRLYQNSVLKTPKFLPVSKPAAPVLEMRDGKAFITLSKSPTGETVQYKVEYRNAKPTDTTTDADWNVVTTPDANASFVLSVLKPVESYWIRYRAVGILEVSEPSDYVSFSYAGKVDITLDQWNLSISSLYYYLRTNIMTNTGLSRWSSLSINSEVTNLINSPSVPYTGGIPVEIKTGMALYFQGTAISTGKSFELNLIAGTKETGNITLHMFVTFGESLFFNTRRGQTWETKETISGPYIKKASAYDLFFLNAPEGWVVYLNGQKVYLFKHRLPAEKVNTIHIYGDTVLNVIGTVPNWSASTFAMELTPGNSRGVSSNLQADVPFPVCNPNKSYAGKLPVTLRPGVALFFQGLIAYGSEGCAINLFADGDIAFHFNPRKETLCFDSCRKGNWENPIEIPSPFINGGAFDLLYFVNATGYEIVVNGQSIYVFNHRFPIEKVNNIKISGPFFMNNFSVVEVGDVNMQIRLPANI